MLIAIWFFRFRSLGKTATNQAQEHFNFDLVVVGKIDSSGNSGFPDELLALMHNELGEHAIKRK